MKKSNWWFCCSVLLLAASSASIQAQFIWQIGLDDNGWPAGNGGGTNATFVQENGTIQPLPGSPTSPETDQQADNDYYLAGSFMSTISSVTALYGAYTPVGQVPVNEEAAERAFAGGDNDLRYHFNLPNTLQPTDRVSVSFDALNLDTSGSDPRYGIEVYFNGVLVQRQIVIRPAQTGRTYTTPQFTLASVNAGLGAGFDNVVSLKGINYGNDGGGQWMGIDYVRLNEPGAFIPAPTYPWAVGMDDNDWPVGNGGGPNATFVQEAGTNPLPGNPASPEVNQQADDDYYFAGLYTTVIAGNGSYTAVGLVPVNEEAAERAFAGTDNDKRYHFNLPNEAGPSDKVAVSFDALNLDDPSGVNTDPRYGVEIYFNGVLVQPEIIIRAAQLGQTFTTLPFTLGSVNAQFGSGFDNIVTLKGINHGAEGGGQWMGIDYVQLNPSTVQIPPPVLPWSVGLDDNDHPPGVGGGTNANFVGEDGQSNPLPGSPESDVFDGDADDDYYFAGAYTTLVPGNGNYIPVGLVPENELSTEKGFDGTDNTKRFHFNIPAELGPDDQLFVSFDALELEQGGVSDPRYGVEVYVNGVKVLSEVVIRPAQLGQEIRTPSFTLASVNAQVGSGFDNIVTLQGINHSASGGSASIAFDYVRLASTPRLTFPLMVGRDDNDWPAGNGGGPNTSFVQENGSINPLPGRANNPEINQQSDNDYYFAGEYTTPISSVVSLYGDYDPLGLVLVNEEGAERAFAAADNDLRYHFNLPDTLQPNDRLAVTFDANNLHTDAQADPRYGIEIYFNGVLVQTQIVIRPAQLGVDYMTPPFTLASVNAQTGYGHDNIISLKGINYNNEGGGNWMGIDYVKLDTFTDVIPPPVFPWSVGKDDNDWPVGDGGGPNATFVQEANINPLPGDPASPEINQQADDDYYFAGLYTNVIAGNGTYTPVGRVGVNEEAAERAFAGTDNNKRYHFNLPSNLSPNDRVSISFDALNLDDPSAANTDPRYGVEIYFNGVLVQPEIVIRAAQLGQKFTTPEFTLGSVNAGFGSGFDNIVTLKGINKSAEGGGQWMGIDYVQLNPPTPAPTFPWIVGRDDNDWPVGDGGGPNATFVQEAGVNPPPGNPMSPEVNQQADDDYYFAGLYTTVIPGNGSYTPIGLVLANEEAAERAFAGTDNDKRYHFNLPAGLSPNQEVTVSFDALNLDDPNAVNTDPRYGVEVYFNGVKVQDEIIIRAAQLGQKFTTPVFTLGSVNAGLGAGFDNIVTLKGINHGAEGGGQWMGIDYVQLNQIVPPPTPVFPWTVGLNDNGWPVGDGGGPNATFVQEAGINPLPGNPANPEVNQMADDDYYFAGVYTTVIAGNGSYTPVGLVPVNEEAAERAFAGTDNNKRYHFNLPANLSPDAKVSVSFDALNLDDPSGVNTDPRYGVEVYFNGVKVQDEIIIRAAQLGQTFSTPPFTLASVNARVGSGFDNIVTLKGINKSAEGGGQWMGIDYVQLDLGDATLPVLVCPNQVRIECGSPTTTWQVSATDDVDGPVAVICTPPSSAGLTVGTQNVVCNASDAAGNRATCSFVVTVADTVLPVVDVAVTAPVQVNNACSQTVTIETDDPTGAVVSYNATGSDACRVVQVGCSPPSGTRFPQGSTTVTCTAVDAGGNTASCSFTVTVKPENECPVAQANVVPPFMLAADGHYLVIAPDNTNAHVIFDGSTSSDADGDALSYAWFEAPPPDNHVPIPPGKKKTKKKTKKSAEEDCAFGKVAELTLQYNGTQAGLVGVSQNGQAVLFLGVLQPGETFTFHGSGKDGDMSPKIAIFVNDVANAAFDTSGKTPIGPGLWSGHFRVVRGTTIKDGQLCVLAPPPLMQRVQFGSNVVAERTLHLGLHKIELEVSDADCTDLATLVVEVITPSRAVEDCILLLAASAMTDKERRPLIETLKKATSDFEKGKFDQALKKLDGFIKKVQKEKSLSQAERNELIACAQYIIDVLEM